VLVSPAWRRADLSEVVLPHRRWLADELAPHGIEVESVVVADDENLAVAERLGLHALKAPNQLGRRFNAGIDHACRVLGADYVCLIGSDQWVHPGPIAAHLPSLGERIGTAAALALVSEDGRRLRSHACTYPGMAGPRIYPATLLEPCKYRPAPDRIMRGCDSAIARGVAAAEYRLRRRRGGPPRPGPSVPDLPWHPMDDPALGALYNVDFKTPATQLHPFDGPLWDRYVVGVTDRPWHALRRHYPAHLVDPVRELYARRRAEAR
jgi:hypothetical protein